MILADITPGSNVTVTVAAAFSVVIAIVLGTWRVAALLNRLERRFDHIDQRFNEIHRKHDETWSIHDMRAWARLLDKANGPLTVPDVDLVTRDSGYRKTGTRAPHDEQIDE